MSGDERLEAFFQETSEKNAEIAERAREMLDSCDDGEGFAGLSFNSEPAEGDPGDLSPGQDVA